MASGEAEPLQYTTTVLRVSIHCQGCKKKVKKVLHNIEGVYKVAVDAAQHKVTVTGSVGADVLVRRLHKSGKQATLWPAPTATATAADAKKPEEVTAVGSPSAGKSGKADAKPKEVVKEAESEGSEKKPEKDKGSEKKPEKDKSSEKKPEKAEAKKPKDEAKKESEVAEKDEGSPEPSKEAAAAEEAGGEETGGKKGKKKKNKQKDAAEGDPAVEKPPPQPQQAMPMPAPALGPDRLLGAFPYYAPQPVMSYNVAHPSSSVSYYAPTPVASMQPMPPQPQMPYGYSPYPSMMIPPTPEFLYGPPGMRSSPTQESYNMFNEENPNSCSLM